MRNIWEPIIWIFLLLMVSCGANGCSWERKTDARGLSRHRTGCHFYKTSSILASLKRQERAKEAVTANLAGKTSANGMRHRNSLVRLGVHHGPRPIAPCTALLAQAAAGCTMGSSTFPLYHYEDSASGLQLQHEDDEVEMQNEKDDASGDQEPMHSAGRFPRHFIDTLPLDEDLNHSDHNDVAAPSPPAPSRIKRVLLTLSNSLQTSFNSFGLSRLYPRRPSFEPDKFIPSSLLATTSPTVIRSYDPISSQIISGPPYPFPNMTIYRLMSWMNTGTTRISESKVASLVKDVMLAEDFDQKHLEQFSIKQSLRCLDKEPSEEEDRIIFPDDWIETSVTISIPTKSKEDGARPYTVPGFHFRPLLEVIRSAFSDIQAGAFHLLPFKRLWKDPLDGHQERIYDELYTSDAWLEAQDGIQKLPREPGCSLERVIAGLMLFSDATHLANFGTAKAWPLYLYFGNLTKYIRSSPTSGACHLVGFLPTLPDCIKDILSSLPRISKTGMSSLQTHCRRELFQACWQILLDEDFCHAYRHGIILKCADGVLRRVFPRIFTYSADYPEKVLIATIKDMGHCPCPRCLTPKSSFGLLGLVTDMRNRLANLRSYALTRVMKARDFIYQAGNTVDGAKVDDALGEGSWVPVLNQFVEKLGTLGLDPFRMLVVDFMHECELGTWKALFTHLLRLLYAIPGGDKLVATLDERFRLVPSFGNGVIRTFANNTSEMKKLAARDFEDILQCSIPVFEGLFPAPHDAIIQSLLYRFAQWHALAKLRIHSDSTLSFLQETFTNLSQRLRHFSFYTCNAFTTVELPKEKAARQKKADQSSGTQNATADSNGPRVKKFNLATYKFHAMGDYIRTISIFGTTDSFTTQIGELAHRALKAFYPLTSKKDTPSQLAKHERRRRILRRVAEAGALSASNNHLSTAESPSISTSTGYSIGTNQNTPVKLFTFLGEHAGDPALKEFIPKLKDHILYRLQKLDVDHCDRKFTEEERNTVIIPNNTIYSMQTLQVHYTTYDLRREYDTINPRTHPDVMVLTGEKTPSHPYWYARVLGIYHMEVWLNQGEPPVRQHLEVLWVRWFAMLQTHKSGTHVARLPKVAFVEETDQDAFGFLDPGQVIRGAHLIPAFASKRGVSALRHGPSFARPGGELDDWEEFYVGIFADRDMFIRYTPYGVGHPPLLRKMARDCLTSSQTPEDMNVEEYVEGDSGDNQEEWDDGFSDDTDLNEDSELEDEGEGSDEEVDLDEDMLDDLPSF